jgi:hypothetical protein
MFDFGGFGGFGEFGEFGERKDSGQEAVGQTLLITVAGFGALGAAQLGQTVVHSLNTLIVALQR